MSITVNITATVTNPLSFPNIIGIGPIIITPPVCNSVFEELEEDWSAVPMNMRSIPSKTAAKPIMIMVL